MIAGIVLTTISVAQTARAQAVLLIHGSESHRAEDSQIKQLTDFLGLKLETLNAASIIDFARASQGATQPKVLAVLVSADVLSSLDLRLQSKLRGPNGLAAPILVFGVNSETSQQDLQKWSGGKVRLCAPLPNNLHPTSLHLSSTPQFDTTLAGTDIPAVTAPACKIAVNDSQTVTALLTEVFDGKSIPLLVKTASDRGDVYFVPELELIDRSWIGKPDSLLKAFSSIAPFLMFLKHEAGDYAWHLDGHYANLTIDDPWLTQPYGNLDYDRLLTDMQAHRFHTTIAFIPWNYDRSEPQVAALFRSHPEYFSVCLHGNNHAHREFGDYAANPLASQIQDIKQGVARMEEFHRLSGIDYDRFMVFPHGVAPEATFAALRKYDFLGTANSLNVPLDKSFPLDAVFFLRPFTNNYAGLLSLSRYSTEVPISHAALGVESYLGNPILFYAHQEAYLDDNREFLSAAGTLNRSVVDTKWASLGDIARHLNEIRERQDGDFDVRIFSNDAILSNPATRSAIFYITGNLPTDTTISKVLLDDNPAEYHIKDSHLELRLQLSPKQTRRLSVVYASEPEIVKEKVHRENLRIYGLRKISDFRDLYLSRHSWGRSLMNAYYGGRGEAFEAFVERRLVPLAGFAVCAIILLWVTVRRRRRGRVMRANKGSLASTPS
jgi:hypothetical protein